MALIEWKYIKKNSNQRLIVDFVKLALPGRAFNVRFLLAANRKKSKLLKDIADKKKTTFIVSTWPELKITSDLCAAGHSITGEDKKRIGKLLQLDASLKCFSVEPIAEVENVSIFSISRPWRSEVRRVVKDCVGKGRARGSP